MAKNSELSINQRHEIVRLVPADARRVLDVGCAWGDVGMALKEKLGCEVTGIEIDPGRAGSARAKLDKVIMEDVDAAAKEFGAGYFDCIIFADVLEHLRSPLDTLRLYSGFLKEGGSIIISVPNIRHISVLFELVVKGRWEYKDSGIMDRGHLRFFTRKSFIRLLDKSGLIPVHTDRIFSLKGSRIFDLITLGLFRDMLTAQYIFIARKRQA